MIKFIECNVIIIIIIAAFLLAAVASKVEFVEFGDSLKRNVSHKFTVL